MGGHFLILLGLFALYNMGQGADLNVTLHVFSGRHDPTWRLTPVDKEYDVILKGMVGKMPTDIPSRLGYKGFTLKTDQDVLTVGRCSYPDFESLLVSTLQPLQPDEPVDVQTFQYVKDDIKSCLV